MKLGTWKAKIGRRWKSIIAISGTLISASFAFHYTQTYITTTINEGISYIDTVWQQRIASVLSPPETVFIDPGTPPTIIVYDTTLVHEMIELRHKLEDGKVVIDSIAAVLFSSPQPLPVIVRIIQIDTATGKVDTVSTSPPLWYYIPGTGIGVWPTGEKK